MSALAQHTDNDGAYLAPYVEIAELAELVLDLAEGVSTLAADYTHEKFVKEVPYSSTMWGPMSYAEFMRGMRR